jgi:hypothetical protein
MSQAMSRTSQGMTDFHPGRPGGQEQLRRSRSVGQGSEAERHSEGPIARSIEEYTAQVPSDVFLWAAGASIAGSLVLQLFDRKHESLFIGQWAPTFLLLGIYNKIVKVAGSDRVHSEPPALARS